MIRFILLFAASSAFGAGYCDLIGTEIYAQDKVGTFLGVVTDNPYLSESITNQYGTYGSKYNAKSVLNEYGSFGGKYSSHSPYNPYTTTPPVLMEFDAISKKYAPVAYLTKNKYIGGVIADPDLLFATLLSGDCGGIYNPPTITKADLIVDSLEAFLSDDKDSIYVSYIVANIGTLNSSAFSVGVAVRNSRSDTVKFPPILPNKYLGDFRGFKITEDTTRIGIFADFFDSTVEFLEDNNLAFADYLTPKTTSARIQFRSKVSSIPKEFNILGRKSLGSKTITLNRKLQAGLFRFSE
ncbi:MAG: hypothetical protein JWP91_408 [Fibrobacteres bacterium]|nr:hypothetical protein [Fibrobacterota bacterium]